MRKDRIFNICLEVAELTCWLIGITAVVWIALTEISERKTPEPRWNYSHTIGR